MVPFHDIWNNITVRQIYGPIQNERVFFSSLILLLKGPTEFWKEFWMFDGPNSAYLSQQFHAEFSCCGMWSQLHCQYQVHGYIIFLEVKVKWNHYSTKYTVIHKSMCNIFFLFTLNAFFCKNRYSVLAVNSETWHDTNRFSYNRICLSAVVG